MRGAMPVDAVFQAAPVQAQPLDLVLGGEGVPEAALPERELRRLLALFIGIRWLFLSGLGVGLFLAVQVFQVHFPVRPTLWVGAAIALYNGLLFAWHRLPRRADVRLRADRIEALLQIGLDLLALTALVRLLGGAESPFICLYLIHGIAGSMLLPRRVAWVVGTVAFVLFLLVVVVDYEAVLPFPPPESLPAMTRLQRPIRMALSIAFLVTLFSSMWITSSIIRGLRLRERQLLHAQEALVRKSDDLQRAYTSLSQQQAQLIQTEKQASLGRLVAGIAHEINNPIQFIHGNMSILSEAFADLLPLLDQHGAARPDLRIARLDYPFFRRQMPVLLEDMAAGAARIGALVRDLKTFARRDDDRLDESVDLTEAVQASLRLLHNQLKHCQVVTDLDPALPRMQGNLALLQQVVVNTLQNAYQALDQGGTIRVRTRAEPGGAWLRLSIEDDGCGIPAAVLDRIFDPFFTTRQRSGGTGLGLAITEGIVQRHQGRIQVESQPGHGTVFHYLLPVKRSPP
jgi:signal transduction histidine kinase